MGDNENIKNAEKELEYLTGDEETRRLAYLREKATKENAKKMYEEGIDIKIISKITGLTEEIKKL